jgi:hypothetical protein
MLLRVEWSDLSGSRGPVKEHWLHPIAFTLPPVDFGGLDI